jgi:hypothetical protein
VLPLVERDRGFDLGRFLTLGLPNAETDVPDAVSGTLEAPIQRLVREFIAAFGVTNAVLMLMAR